jgi:hypothetical protein
MNRRGGQNSEDRRRQKPAGHSFADFLSPTPDFLDLFGDPILPPRGRGRPGHTPTIENYRKIKAFLKRGWSQKRIAAAIGITIPTLTAHYFRAENANKSYRRLTLGPPPRGDQNSKIVAAGTGREARAIGRKIRRNFF